MILFVIQFQTKNSNEVRDVKQCSSYVISQTWR